MKRYATLAVMLLTALTLGLSTAQAGTIDEDTNAILHFEIMYDTYCDGVALDVNTADGIATGVYGSVCATCPFTNLMGGTVGDILGPLGLTANLGWDDIGTAGVLNLFTRLNANGTWTHYYFDGTVMNSGTWSPCPKGHVSAPDNAVPSTSPAALDRE
jgi:hypothetical protein